MQTLALVIVIAAALWLVWIGVLMMVRPVWCLDLFERLTTSLEAANWRVNLTEQGLRMLGGVALIVRAPVSKLPQSFQIAGWVIVVSSLLILAVPIRWHGGYSRWWVGRIAPIAVRLLAPVALIVGGGLIYAALQD